MLQFDKKYKKYLILEDDATLIQKPEDVRKYLSNLPTTFDMAYLNGMKSI